MWVQERQFLKAERNVFIMHKGSEGSYRVKELTMLEV
jgi:hypothetical protein